MINWKKDDWVDVQAVLEALDIEYETTFEGNLILHFKDFDIFNEKTGDVVDHVEHMWLLFQFIGGTYDLKFYRSDLYLTNLSYVHPHVNGSTHCTGSYTKGVSLTRDILYYSKYVEHYNDSSVYTRLPNKAKLSVDVDTLNKSLIPTFYLDITKGCPQVSNVECTSDLQSFLVNTPLTNPPTFYWKGERITQKSKGGRAEDIDFKQYFNYDKFYKDYLDYISSQSNNQTDEKIS